MLPLYKLTINEDDETGVDFNSFVDVPAHMKAFMAFSDQESIKTFFVANDEKRLVTGVMIAADMPIFRRDEIHGEHNVFFPAEEIEKIQKKFMLEGNANNVNKMHDMNKAVPDGAVLLYNYLIGGDRNPKAPEAFKNMNLQDGSWIGTYFIKDNQLWNEVKEGKFQGFSVEGYFNREKVEIKTKKSKMKKSIWEMAFGKKELSKQNEKFESVEAVDGTVLNYDGELNVDTPLFIQGEGEEMVQAPAGEYQITMDDVTMILTVSDEGLVSSIEEVTEEDMKAEARDTALKAEVAEVVGKITEDTDERFKALEAKFEASEEKNAKLEEFISKLTDSEGNKFNAQHKKAGKKEGASRRELLNGKK